MQYIVRGTARGLFNGDVMFSSKTRNKRTIMLVKRYLRGRQNCHRKLFYDELIEENKI